jgi:hypothetical protein
MALNDPMRWLRRQTNPITIGICFLLVLGSIASWLSPKFGILVAFDGKILPRLWALLSYPYSGSSLAGSGIIFLAFLIMWMWSIGGAIERDHGSRNFLLLWLLVTVLSSLSLAILQAPAVGVLLPEAAITVMWAARNKTVTVRMMGIIPVPSWVVGALLAAIVFFTYASTAAGILTGLVALTTCGLSFLYASNKIPKLSYGLGYGSYTKRKPTQAQKKREAAFRADVFDREQERADRERLRKLFESSIEDDSGDGRKK